MEHDSQLATVHQHYSSNCYRSRISTGAFSSVIAHFKVHKQIGSQIVSQISKGVCPLQDKVKAIQDFLQPTIHCKLYEFLGFAKFYHHFLPHCTDTIKPLHILLTTTHKIKISCSGTKSPYKLSQPSNKPLLTFLSFPTLMLMHL